MQGIYLEVITQWEENIEGEYDLDLHSPKSFANNDF